MVAGSATAFGRLTDEEGCKPDRETVWFAKPKKSVDDALLVVPGGKQRPSSDMDWITALAQQADTVVLPTKEARAAKRQAKKERRQQLQQQQRKKQKTQLIESSNSNGKRNSHRQAKLLHKWRQDWQRLVEQKAPKYSPPVVTSDRQPRNFPHTVRHKKIPLTSDSKPQPRSRDYGGLGLAQPSIYLEFTDPSWSARLATDFATHVAGWSGKPPMVQAVKKQRDANLLWKRLQRAKRDGKGGRPDVQAMLESEDLV